MLVVFVHYRDSFFLRLAHDTKTEETNLKILFENYDSGLGNNAS